MQLANKKLSTYLELSAAPPIYRSVRYKLHIADAFKEGARKTPL